MHTKKQSPELNRWLLRTHIDHLSLVAPLDLLKVKIPFSRVTMPLQIANEKIRLFGVDAPETKQSCQDSKGHPYDCGEFGLAPPPSLFLSNPQNPL